MASRSDEWLREEDEKLIIEGLLVTAKEDGAPHVAPMGPVVNAELSEWTLRPFASSTTFKLLRARPVAVFHVVDDVLPVVQAALGMEDRIAVRARPWGRLDSCRLLPLV